MSMSNDQLNELLLHISDIFPNKQAHILQTAILKAKKLDDSSTLALAIEIILEKSKQNINKKSDKNSYAIFRNPKTQIQLSPGTPVHFSPLDKKKLFKSKSYRTAAKSALYLLFPYVSQPIIDSIFLQNLHNFSLSRQAILFRITETANMAWWNRTGVLQGDTTNHIEDTDNIENKSDTDHLDELQYLDDLQNMHDTQKSKRTLRKSQKSKKSTFKWWVPITEFCSPGSVLKNPDLKSLIGKFPCTELDDEIKSIIHSNNLENDQELIENSNITPKIKTKNSNTPIECECCYSSISWDNAVSCSNGHLFCFQCIQSSVHEGLYSSGSLLRARHNHNNNKNKSNLDFCSPETCIPIGELRCFSASATPNCFASFPNKSLKNALGLKAYLDFQNKIQAAELDALSSSLSVNSNYSLVRCSSCAYAELDGPISYHINYFSLSLIIFYFLIFFISNYLLIKFLFFNYFLPKWWSSRPLRSMIYSLFSISSSFFLKFCFSLSFSDFHPFSFKPWLSIKKMKTEFHTKASKYALNNHMLHNPIFRCRSPSCGIWTCRKCSQPFVLKSNSNSAKKSEPVLVHECFGDDAESLRKFVEMRMSEAIKRECPRCGLSFVKSYGCNKLVCSCGFAMCYLCRADIVVEGYRHFCQHFRIHPGKPCSECSKCLLYKNENDNLVLENAARAAEKEWYSSFRNKIKPNSSEDIPISIEVGASRIKLGSSSNSGISFFTNYLEWVFSKVIVVDHPS